LDIEMKQYIGTKLIKAKPMTRGGYSAYRGHISPDVPPIEAPEAEGYLVEYSDGGNPNDKRHDGYISWSPKAVFDKAYRPTDGMTFGMAIEAAQRGCAITRPGLGANVVFMSGMTLPSFNTQDTAPKENDRTAKYIGQDTSLNSKPYLAAYTVDEAGRVTGNWQPGWLPTAKDLLATDWFLDETQFDGAQTAL
jgi:hypothetical protein